MNRETCETRRSGDQDTVRRLVGNERGATAFLLAAGMSVFLGATAIAVDLGMLATARTEAQRTADAAALAGASALVFVPNDARKAREWAQEYATLNAVRGIPVTLREQDIQVIGDTVRVTVLRSQDYGGPVETIFARVFGVDGVDISAVAAAHAASQAAVVNCLLPITLADRWVNQGSAEWDPSEGDY
jgi:Flp pilus assembly protein TadG